MKFLQDPVERLLYISLAVFFLIVFLSIVGIFVRLKESSDQARALQSVVTEENQHVDCVALLLAQSNRSDIRIQDLDNCRIGP